MSRKERYANWGKRGKDRGEADLLCASAGGCAIPISIDTA